MTVCNTRTRFVNRGSPTFMVPEIQTETQLIDSVGNEDVKKIDIWELTVRVFLIVSPEIFYPYENDVKELQNECAGKTFCIQQISN